MTDILSETINGDNRLNRLLDTVNVPDNPDIAQKIRAFVAAKRSFPVYAFFWRYVSMASVACAIIGFTSGLFLDNATATAAELQEVASYESVISILF